MKKMLAFYFLFLYSIIGFAAPTAVVPAAVVPEEINFNGVVHVKAYNTGNDKSSLVEYIPKGQTLDNWNSIISINHYFEVQDPALLAKNIETNIKNGKNGTTFPIQTVDNNPNDVIQPFILIGVSDKTPIIESNVWRFKKSSTSKGVVGLQYATRKYGVDPKTMDMTKFDVTQEITGLKNLPIDTY